MQSKRVEDPCLPLEPVLARERGDVEHGIVHDSLVTWFIYGWHLGVTEEGGEPMRWGGESKEEQRAIAGQKGDPALRAEYRGTKGRRHILPL
jgi:hypothetical protein